MRPNYRLATRITLSLLVLLLTASLVRAQSSVFTYQRKLSVSGSPATTNHDFEFKLFNAFTDGAVNARFSAGDLTFATVIGAVAANPGAAGRKGTITIGGKQFSVKQKGN